MKSFSSIQPLVDLGLTALEAEVYCFLVENSPATGYKIAKAIGKPTANTYKTIQALQAKGFIFIEDGTNRLCRAQPVKEFLDGLEKRFKQTRRKAENEFSKMKPAPDDERLYYLHTPDQVFEKLQQMLSTCEEIALLDLFPAAVEHLKKDIEKATSNGIRVAVKVYQPCEIRGAVIQVDPAGEKIIKRWPGQWANGVIDGFEHLMAFLSRDCAQVHQAVWSANTYISWVYHSAFMFELLHGALTHPSQKKENAKIFSENYLKLTSFLGQKAKGYHTLMERFGDKQSFIKPQ